MNQALLQGAWRAHREGNLTEAARLYGEVLRQDPAQFDALYALGVLHYQKGAFADAERALKRAAERNPNVAEPWFTLGCALHRLNRPSEALAAFDRALAVRPAYPEALANKGGVLMGERRSLEALACFDAAVGANPSFAEGWNNRGNALSELGRHEEAVASYDRVLALHPGVPQALVNKGTALIALKRFQDAIASYGEALRSDPNSADARNGQANALFLIKRYEEAARDYAAALRVNDSLAYGPGNLAFVRLHVCDWRHLGEDRARITADLQASKHTINPFQALALLESEEDQLRAVSLWMADKHPDAAMEPWRGKPYMHERIRVAYLSADFNEHAVATQIAGVFEHHDRSKFDAIGISLADGRESPMRMRLKNAFGCFIEAEAESDAAIAARLRELEVDIAIDLMGFTGESRPGILAARAAPVQVQFLGFPGTMGASHIDYLIADRTVIPAASRKFYSEAIANLPDCYLPNDSTRGIAERRSTRAEAGLADSAFVFASFNNSYKFSPEVFSVWMRLLRAVEGSALWLAESNTAAMRNLRGEAQRGGIAPERIVFAPFARAPEDHLARLSLADLFLDTLPYNAHSTACDALWAGLPVLTCEGTTFAGRVGASLLTAIGLPELIARSVPEYEEKALAFARNPADLAAAKAKLAANRGSLPLFDTARFTRNLEGLYTQMWLHQWRGLAPAAME